MIDMNIFIRKRESAIRIKTIPALAQIATAFRGWYNMSSGEIGIGCTERDIYQLLFHEYIHKYLFENVSLEASIMWDNISEELDKFLFENIMTDPPYIFTIPTKKALTLPNVHKSLSEKGLESNEKIVNTTINKQKKRNYKKIHEKLKKDFKVLL